MYRVGILTISDSCFRRKRQDISGIAVRSIIEKEGFKVDYYSIIPDEKAQIAKELKYMADGLALNLIITTGGTGFGPRDITPEATLEVLDRIAHGIPEAMRMVTSKDNPRSILSRAVAGIRKETLIINLPGSTDGVKECLTVIMPLLPHAFEMLEGKGHD